MSMKNKSKTLFSMLAAGAFALTSLTAHANTITLQFVSVVPDGFGAFNWTYTYALENSVLMRGDYFNLLDFGPATVVVPPTGPLPAWVYTQPATGPIPASIIPQNGGDTAVVNAVFTWTDGIAVVGSSV